MKAIDNKELILALEDLENEKGIKKEYLLESIEAALVTAYKRNFDALENVKVVMDRQTGATYIYSVKEVVEVANDPVQEISLRDAKKINKTLQIGDTVDVEIVPKGIKVVVNPWADKRQRKPNVFQNVAADLFAGFNDVRAVLRSRSRQIQALNKVLQRKLNL